MVRKNPSPELLRELLHYDPETGVFTWRKRDLRHFKSLNSWSRWNNMFAGRRAGAVYVGSTGYRCIQIGVLGFKMKAHRIAWMYMTGSEPPKEIDHIDRDGTNNKWSNLRSGVGVNNYNLSMRRDNKSGVSGVSWSKVANMWNARAWCVKDGKRRYQHIGYFKDIDEARKAIESFRREYGYSRNHGRSHAPYVKT